MNSQSFYVKYEYPMTGNATIDNEIKLSIDDKVKNFYQEIGPSQIDGIEYSLDITYDKKVYKNYETYIMYNTVYTGGAHPNTTIETFTYINGRKITIEDLFNKEQLQKIASYIYQKLMENPGSVEDMVKEGTLPDYDNFQDFYYNEKGIVFIFEQYQVAPYSSGIIEVLVPSQELKIILNH